MSYLANKIDTVRGYWRQLRIIREINRSRVLNGDRLEADTPLPQRYGIGLHERVIEILYVYSLYDPSESILDVGCSNVMPCHRHALKELGAKDNVVGLDIVECTFTYRKFYKNIMIADIQDVDVDQYGFDQIWCISTLEHVGMDNSKYGVNTILDSNAAERAMVKMANLLNPKGSLYVTLPFGLLENHGWLKNYDKESVERLLAGTQAQFSRIEQFYFKYDDEQGWERSDDSALAETGYYDGENGGTAGLCCLFLQKQ